jgi:hypothetical protein
MATLLSLVTFSCDAVCVCKSPKKTVVLPERKKLQEKIYTSFSSSVTQQVAFINYAVYVFSKPLLLLLILIVAQ